MNKNDIEHFTSEQMVNWTHYQLNTEQTNTEQILIEQKVFEQNSYWTKTFEQWTSDYWTTVNWAKWLSYQLCIVQLTFVQLSFVQMTIVQLTCVELTGKLLHPSEFMAWINCGLDQAWKSSRVRENYYILQTSWLGSIVVWIRHGSRQGLEEIITSFRVHGLDQLWFGSGMEIIKG